MFAGTPFTHIKMSKDDKNKEVEKKFEDLTPEEQAQLVADLKADKADLSAKLTAEKEAHKISNEKSLGVIGELKKQVELKDELAKAGSKIVVKHKNKSYTVEINSFRLDGEACNAKDLQEKPELMDKLIKLGSGVIQETK